ncbi:MAG: hypothetical protein ACREAY_05765 [Nitrososphaera sp.]|uniref:hypothetical protein n=1 Tax=Nitrososphaera sp. TaxID=1971748 RepID=UPI003D6ED1EC
MKQLALSAIIAAVLFGGLGSQAHANQLDALMLPDADRSQIQLTAFRNIEIRYAAQSAIGKILDGETKRVEFVASGKDAQAIVDRINEIIRSERKSPVTIQNATVTYVATVKGFADRALLSYNVDVKGNVTGYVLQAEKGKEPAILDLDWRNFKVEGPVVADTQHGAIDVNSPAGPLHVLMPEVADELAALYIMQDPILDFSRFGLPMKQWHYLFDVTGKQLEQYDVFIPGEGGTVSIHSIGESSFREGTYLPAEKDEEATVAGTQVKLHASTPPPSGHIIIAGYSKVQESEGAEYALVSSKFSGGPEFGFQFQVLMVLGGMMGAIAVFVLYKSRH